MKAFISGKEVAEILGVSPARVYEMLAEGVLPYVHLHPRGKRRIPRGAFEQWLRQKEQEALRAVRQHEP